MQTGHIEIFVKDTLASKDFYINVLGFELVEIQYNVFVWLKSGDLLILLRPGNEAKEPANEYRQSKIGFVLYTDNLNESAEKMRGKGLVFKGTDGSEKCLTFTDRDGNWFQLVNPADH